MASKKSRKVVSSILAIATGLSISANALFLKPKNVYALEGEAPKVSASNPSWYSVSNQPASAVFQEREERNLELVIGSTSAEIDGSSSILDAAPYIKSGRTMVPVRFISEGLGADVAWNATEKKVTINLEGKEVLLYIGKNYGYVAGKKVSLEAPPEIKSGRTMVPVRFISEGFGADVSWDAPSKTVSISKETLGVKTINENSDADSDGLTFAVEKNLGTNPNNKNTIYSALTDGKLSEVKGLYPTLNIFAKNPDGKTDVSLTMKVSLGIDPTNPNNFDAILDDFNAIRYAREKGAAVTNTGISGTVSQITAKYGNGMGNTFRLIYSDGKTKESEISPLIAKATDALSEIYEQRFRKAEGKTLADFIDSFTPEEGKALTLILKETSSEMDAPLAQIVAYSKDQNFAANNPAFYNLIKSFPGLNDSGKTISQYEIFTPVLAQPGARWRFAFDFYSGLKISGVDITKSSDEDKLMFFSFVEARGPLYESIYSSKKGQDFLSETSVKNFLAWQERKKLLSDSGFISPKISFLEMGLLANPVSTGYLDNFRIEGGFLQMPDLNDDEVISLVKEMYNTSMDDSAKKIIEFEKANLGKNYPKYDAKTDLSNPADMGIALDPFGYLEGQGFEKYFGLFGQKSTMLPIEGKFGESLALDEIARVFALGNSLTEEQMIRLGGNSTEVYRNYATLFKAMAWANNVPVMEEYIINEGRPFSLPLSGGSYKPLEKIKLEKLGISYWKNNYDYDSTYLYFNPYLLDGDDPFNFDISGVFEVHTYEDMRGTITRDYLSKFPKFEEIEIPTD